MTDRVVVTVVTRNYYHTARALAESVQAADPGTPVYVCLADRPVARPAWEPSPGGVLHADELGIPDWRRFAFQYAPLELVCALKPFALERALDLTGAKAAVYLDADVLVYDSLRAVTDLMPASEVLLTPHRTRPEPGGAANSNDRELLSAGAYNAGFFAVAGTPGGRAVLGWLQSHMRSECAIDHGGGLFADQKWLDLVPSLFDRVRVDRRPGLNVAYWNLAERPLARAAAGRYTAAGEPLVFFHFSGFDPAEPGRLSKWAYRAPDESTAVLRELTAGYAARLAAAIEPATDPRHGYAFATLADGTPIGIDWREAVRMGHPALDGVADPFTAPDLMERLAVAAPAAQVNRVTWRAGRAEQLQKRIEQLAAARDEAEETGRHVAHVLDTILASPVLGRIIRLYQRLGRLPTR